jgi:endo-1,4-beta-xylanase
MQILEGKICIVLLVLGLMILAGCRSTAPDAAPTTVSPTEVSPTLIPAPAEELAAAPTVTPIPLETTETVGVEETLEASVPVPEPGVYDFEDGASQGWEPWGATAVTVSTDVAYSGAQSIAVTERKETWQGAAVDVLALLEPDKTYAISAYARVADGQPESQFTLTMQRTVAGETAVSEWVASSPLLGAVDPQWVKLGGQYSYTGDAAELLLVVKSPAPDLTAFYLDHITITEVVDSRVVALLPPQTDIPSLSETFADQFLIGAALEPHQLDSEYHAALLTRHFNIVTAENVMKPVSIQPNEGEFTWDEADILVAFARDNGLAIHGHTLVWHSQVPDWMFEDAAGNTLEPTPESKELVLQRLETHIRAVTERYRDDIILWDVVNEAIDPVEEDCMRRSLWYELTGTDYIATAFRVADEVLPDVSLILNDYSTTDPQKRECIYNLVQAMQADGVPIDGIGMQMHVNIESPSAAAVEQTIQRFAELGEVHITEMDMSIYTNDTDSYSVAPEDVLVQQGYRYKELFEVFERQAESIETVTFWGMGDDHTWLKTWPTTRLNLPLLFDEALQAKYAYWGIVDPEQLPVLNQMVDIAYGSPEIDGEIDDLWLVQPWVVLAASEELTVSMQMRWDENNLYLFVQAEGPANDLETIDVFLDPNNSKTEAYEGDERRFTFQGGECADCDGVVFESASGDAFSYLEAAIALGAAEGDTPGFDIRVTRASVPEAPVSWNDRTHSQDSDTSKFGSLHFVQAAKMTTAVPGTPLIDGEEDEIWADAEEVVTEVWVLGDSGSTGAVRTMWDDQHLYAFVVITDTLLSKAASNPWEQDSFEIYIDQNNAKTTTYQPDDVQYRINFDNEQSFLGGAAAEKITSVSKITPDGYIIELAIRLDAIEPHAGMIIGFEFQVNNDENGDGIRNSVITWNDPTHQSYQNTSRFGLLMFGQ